MGQVQTIGHPRRTSVVEVTPEVGDRDVGTWSNNGRRSGAPELLFLARKRHSLPVGGTNHYAILSAVARHCTFSSFRMMPLGGSRPPHQERT